MHKKRKYCFIHACFIVRVSWYKIPFLLWVAITALIHWPFPTTYWRRHYYKLHPIGGEIGAPRSDLIGSSFAVGCTVRSGTFLLPESGSWSHSKIYPDIPLMNWRLPFWLKPLQVGFLHCTKPRALTNGSREVRARTGTGCEERKWGS